MNRYLVMYIASLLLAGTNGVIANSISMASWDIVLYRGCLGSALMLAVMLATRRRFTFRAHPRAFAFLVASGVSLGANWMFLYESYRLVGVGVGILSDYCGPMIVIALSPLVFGERITKFRLAALASVVCGVVLVNGELMVEGSSAAGIICCVMSAVTYALLVIFNKKAADISGVENTMWQLFIGMIVAAVYVGAAHGRVAVPMREDVVPLLIFCLFNTGFGMYLFFAPMKHLAAQTIVTCGYIEPLSAVVFSAIFLGERMSIAQMCGAALIIGGSVLGEVMGRPGADGSKASR